MDEYLVRDRLPDVEPLRGGEAMLILDKMGYSNIQMSYSGMFYAMDKWMRIVRNKYLYRAI